MPNAPRSKEAIINYSTSYEEKMKMLRAIHKEIADKKAAPASDKLKSFDNNPKEQNKKAKKTHNPINVKADAKDLESLLNYYSKDKSTKKTEAGQAPYSTNYKPHPKKKKNFRYHRRSQGNHIDQN